MTARQISTVTRKLQRAIGEAGLTALGRETGFTERLREVTPQRLALSLVGALGSRRVRSLADLQRAFNALTGRSVRYKPFHNQLAKPAFPVFMRALVERLLGHLTMRVLAPLPGNVLRQLTDIVIQDGSSFALKSELQEHFPGRFTTMKPAAVEVHATVSLYADQLTRVSVAPDAQGERDFLPPAEDLRGQLILADRGYCSLEYFRQVHDAGAFFLIRVRKDLNPKIQECWVGDQRWRKLEGERLHDVQGKLRGRTAELIVSSRSAGQELEYRLVLAWNASSKQHVRLATNLDIDSFNVESVQSLYRLRWQVELMFKEWKSHANLHDFGTRKPRIAEGLIWAALAAALLKRCLAHATQLASRRVEVSTQTTAACLGYHLPALIQAALRGRGLRARLQELMAYLTKNARRAHPARDRERGRLRDGLGPLRLDAALRLCPLKN